MKHITVKTNKGHEIRKEEYIDQFYEAIMRDEDSVVVNGRRYDIIEIFRSEELVSIIVKEL